MANNEAWTRCRSGRRVRPNRAGEGIKAVHPRHRRRGLPTPPSLASGIVHNPFYGRLPKANIAATNALHCFLIHVNITHQGVAFALSKIINNRGKILT